VKAVEAELKSAKASAKHDPDAVGEKRGMLQCAGTKGVSFEGLHAECNYKNRKSSRDALYLLSTENGYAPRARMRVFGSARARMPPKS
jgi:hypothetical protein